MGKSITDIPGIGPKTAEILFANSFKTLAGIASSPAARLAEVPGFGMSRATVIIEAANKLLKTTAANATKMAATRSWADTARAKPICGRKSQRDRAAAEAQEGKSTQRSAKKKSVTNANEKHLSPIPFKSSGETVAVLSAFLIKRTDLATHKYRYSRHLTI
ncbi:MAG: helix-hairpin-helix domain-containing protein [Gammaproteobacteria bacterium]|nr:helix-hairpin-helix domain-containing protein [Gammaproteobacteria bacterium]